MLTEARRCGAPIAVEGMNSAAIQAASGEADHQREEDRRAAVFVRGEAAGDGAGEDGDEGRAFDQRVAGGQFVATQMVGQDAVFHRPEQRAENAEAGERGEHQRQRRQQETGGGQTGDENLDEFQPLRDARLVVAVGDLAAEAGEHEIGRDQDAARQRDQRAAVAGAALEQDHEDQRRFQEIVVEGGAKLAPEQRREPPREQQRRAGRVHATLIKAKFHAAPSPPRRSLQRVSLEQAGEQGAGAKSDRHQQNDTEQGEPHTRLLRLPREVTGETNDNRRARFLGRYRARRLG